MPRTRAVRFYIDTELRLLHTELDCPELKVARKYNYVESVLVETPQEGKVLDEKYRPCPRCRKKEERKKDMEQRRGTRRAGSRGARRDYSGWEWG